MDIDLEANSATEAQYAVSWRLADLVLPEKEIETALEEHIPMTEQAQVQEWTYAVTPAKIIPPEQDLFVSLAQKRLRSS